MHGPHDVVPPAKGLSGSFAALGKDLAEVATELSEAIAPGLQLIERLGAGGMGAVFLARDPALKRSVAIKVLLPGSSTDPVARQRFVREAQAAATLSHPHIIGIYQVGELPRSGSPYFVMQFVDGDTLEHVIAGRPLSQPALRRLIGEVSLALAAAHQRHLVHRDIKPANIMIERGSGRAIVLDFGIAAATSRPADSPDVSLTATGTSIGTPTHMSPEQALGQQVTDRSDIYSLGLVAFTAATGRHVFDAPNAMAMLAAHIHQQPPPVRDLRPDLDSEIASLIDRCLAKEPTARPSADEIARRLAPQSRPVVEWPPPGLELVRERGLRLMRAIRLTAAALVLFFAAVYVQPSAASPAWSEGESSFFWRAVNGPRYSIDRTFLEPTSCAIRRDAFGDKTCPPRWPDSSSAWFFLLTVLLIAVVASGAGALRRLWRFTREARRMRAAGYPAEVIAAAAVDEANDTAGLVNGVGIFASLAPADRASFIGARRRALSVELWGILGVFIAPGVMLLLPTSAVFGDVFWLTTPALLVVLLPAVALGGALWLRLPERRWKRSALRRDHSEAAVRPEIVHAWVSTRPVDQLPHGPGRGVLSALPIPLLFGAIVALGIMGFIAWDSVWLSRSTQGWTAGWRSGKPGEESIRSEPLRWIRVDSAIAPLIDARYTVVARDTAARARYDNKEVRYSVQLPWARTWDSLPVLAGRERLRLMAADTIGIPLDSVRRLAAQSRGNLASLPGGDEASIRVIGRTMTSSQFGNLAKRNEGAAYLALMGGDTATALRRINENLIIGRAALLQGGPPSTIVARDAAAALEAISRVRGDRATFERASYTRQLIDRYLLSLAAVMLYPGLLTANPRDSVVVAEIGHHGNAAVVRRELLAAVVGGYCFNGREILFGLSPRRDQSLEKALAAAADLPGAAARAARLRKQLADLRATGGVLGWRKRIKACPY